MYFVNSDVRMHVMHIFVGTEYVLSLYRWSELEITVGHQPFSDYLKDLAEQIQFC